MSEAIKRSKESRSSDNDSDQSDGWVGPMPSEAARPKKRKGNNLLLLYNIFVFSEGLLNQLK